MHSCPECGQRVPRRGRRAEALAFEVLDVRDHLAQYAPRHQDLLEVCAQGDDFARHLHIAAHEGARATPVWSRRAKRWLRSAENELDTLIKSKEVPATWAPLAPRAVAAEGMNKDTAEFDRVLISA
jgi:hypothetical protein